MGNKDRFWYGLALGIGIALAFNWLHPFYPKGSMAYMMPKTLAPNSAELILLPAANSDEARSGVAFLCHGLEQWQDEGVAPENHRWCKAL
jgi:hypothetical protein